MRLNACLLHNIKTKLCRSVIPCAEKNELIHGYDYNDTLNAAAESENLHPTLEDIKKMEVYLCSILQIRPDFTGIYAIFMYKYTQNPLDMFPWTAHVESIIWMQIVDKDKK